MDRRRSQPSLLSHNIHTHTQLDHAVVATKFTDTTGRSRLAASHRLLKGYLVNSDGHTVREMSSGKSDRVSYVGGREGGERELHMDQLSNQLYMYMYDCIATKSRIFVEFHTDTIHTCTLYMCRKLFFMPLQRLLPNPSTINLTSMIFPCYHHYR